MQYRLIRNQATGETLVIGADGYLSPPLPEGSYRTADAELRADWWRVERGEYNTALWGHPLWAVLASCDAPADGRHVVAMGEAGRRPVGAGLRRTTPGGVGVVDPPGSATWPVGPPFGGTAAGTGYSGAGATG